MTAKLDAVRALATQETGLATMAIALADGTVHASVVNAGLLDDPVPGRASVAFVAVGGAKKLDLLCERGQATVVFRRGWTRASTRRACPCCCATSSPRPARTTTGTSATGPMAAERRCGVFVEASRISGTA